MDISDAVPGTIRQSARKHRLAIQSRAECPRIPVPDIAPGYGTAVPLWGIATEPPTSGIVMEPHHWVC